MNAAPLMEYVGERRKWSYISVAISLYLAYKVYKVFHVPATLRHIPAVPYWRMIKSYLAKDSPQMRLERLTLPVIRRSNGIYLNKVPFEWTVYIADPVAVKSLLLSKDMPKDPASLDMFEGTVRISEFFGTHSLALCHEAGWRRQPKLMNPPFNRAMPVDAFGTVMLRLYQTIENDYDGKDVQVMDLMRKVCLATFGLGIFGLDFKALEERELEWTTVYQEMRIALVDIFAYLFPSSGLLARWFFPERSTTNDAISRMSELLADMTEERRLVLEAQQQGDGIERAEIGKDLLTIMVEALMRDDGTLSSRELKENIASTFIAGYEIPSHVMSLCIYYLAIHKDIQDNARREVLDILGDGAKDVLPIHNNCERMEYLRMVIKETLRLAPTVDLLWGRTTRKDLYLCNTLIPKGTTISIDIHAIQNNPDIWDNPSEFRPDRFAKGGENDKLEGMTWLPFSNGERKCIGAKFFMMEQVVCLAMLLRKYNWDLPEDSIHRNGLVYKSIMNAAPESLTMNFTKRY
ncbi:cytochrome P450 [Radiomyces spectabilis]|uniref:cytochrome P450 n=1 Tax=Radiomyces spectabilis TaxID=64574 RepID=UPI00221E43C5|nr:cytochrome P450 [Radiomyces spectabilis]KAI8391342.1 cytochrome P450 [Radiomyces spectabilis]